MKKILLPVIAIALGGLAGCETKERLANQIQGTWTGAPQKIEVAGAYDADVIKTYEFMPDSTAVISAMISFSKALPDTDTLVEPVSLSAAGTAAIRGTYTATSYNKIEIKLDMSSMMVSVDPSAVNFMYNGLTTDEKPAMGTMSEGLIDQLQAELTPDLKADFAGSSVLSDIKIGKDNTLTCTIDATTVTLAKATK